jgi:eukaryotic-like serine/threonine-protein kinase
MNHKPDEFADTGQDHPPNRGVNPPFDFLTPIDRLEIDQLKFKVTSVTVVESRPIMKQDPHPIDEPYRTPSFENDPHAKVVEGTSEFCLPSRIGRFEVIERLGVGGHGIVFRAIDRGVGREVAIKVPRTELLSSREQMVRFAREASIVGLLEHPNIVPVYESDWHGTVPYIVMPFIRGKTLREWRAGQPTVAPRTCAEIVRQLATAMQHAHERGVLHRDLKPGNVLLASAEKDNACAPLGFIPKLTDFGSAKCEVHDAAMTRTGAMIGTTAYMSPEQIEGRNREITAQTDVYGLGVILYEMLTGHPPFYGDSVPETLQKISNNAPAFFESCRVDIPFNLKVICLKCLEKTPSNRYRSASALADDLQRFLDGEPISARPVSTAVRIVQWCRQHPFLTANAGLVVLGILTLTSISLYYNSLLVEQLDRTESARKQAREHQLRAIQSEEKSRKRAYVGDMRNAKLSWDQGDVRQMLKLLDRHGPQNGQSDIRDFAWWYLWREYHESSRVLGTHENEARAVAITRSGDVAASGGTDSVIKLWSLPSGQLVTELRGHGPGPIHSLSFSPTGKHLASAGEDGTLRIWDVGTGQEMLVRHEHQSAVVCVVYSSQCNLIASSGMDGTVRLWNSETAEPVAVLSGHTKKTRCLAFHPSEPLLVSGSLDGTIRFWNLDDDGTNVRFTVRATCDLSVNFQNIVGCYPRAIAIEPNGESLVCGTTGCEVVQVSLLNHNFGDVIERTIEAHHPHTLIWLHNDDWLVGLGNSQIRMANARSPKHTLASLRGHANLVFSIAASADASCLVSASQDGTVRYWPNFRERNQFRVTPAETGGDSETSEIGAIEWCGQYLTVDDLSRRQVSVFRMPECKFVRAVSHSQGGVARLSPSGKYLVLVEPGGVATCVQVEDGTVVWANRFADGTANARTYPQVVIDQSDEWIGIADENKLVLISLASSKVEYRLEHPSAVQNVVFINRIDTTPKIISTDFHAALRIWDAQDGRLLKTFSIGSHTTTSLATSIDRQLLAAVFRGRRIRIWELEGMAEVASISTHYGDSVNISFLLGGSNILAYPSQGVTLWNVEEEAELIQFPEYLNAQGSFASSPDGRQLAVCRNGVIHLIDGRSPDEVEKQIRIPRESLAASPSR